MSREDGQQSIQSVTLHYPPGVSGLLSGVAVPRSPGERRHVRSRKRNRGNDRQRRLGR